MKKVTIFLILLGCLCSKLQIVHAQEISASVGNPESTNTMILTNITETMNTPENQIPNDMEPLPGSPGVEVAPPPNRIPQNSDNLTPPDFTNSPPIEINETINIE